MGIKDYQKIENTFYENIIKFLGENVLLYCVTGSLGRGDLVPGWSDIDILLVYKNLDNNTLSGLGKIIRKNKSSIKIGITQYTLNEFNDPLYKDPKTYQNINQILEGTIKPKILSPKIKIHRYKNLEIIDNIDVAKSIHSIKRQLILGPEGFDEKNIYKELIMILKVSLRNKGINVFGYNNILKLAQSNINFNVDIKGPEEILQLSNQKQQRYASYVEFLRWLENNRYWKNNFFA